MKPKFNYSDEVTFTVGSTEVIGTIAIIDANGTWENPNEVSYDIMGTWMGAETLFKHIPEHIIKPIVT